MPNLHLDMANDLRMIRLVLTYKWDYETKKTISISIMTIEYLSD